MGRRNGVVGDSNEDHHHLHVSVPSFFRCPISLDVMKSPVSLCTGVTYDRSSIQTWLDGGHDTCPATMQVLPTKDFVPNHTLHRLIQLWSHQNHNHHSSNAATSGDATINTTTTSSSDLIRLLRSEPDPSPVLRRLADDGDRIRQLAGEDNAGFVSALGSLLLLTTTLKLESLESTVKILSLLLDNNPSAADKSLSDRRTILSVLAVMKQGAPVSRIAAARVLEIIAGFGTESKLLVAETEGVLPELLRLVTGEEADPSAVDAGLSCLVAVTSPRRVRPQAVRVAMVAAVGRILARPSSTAAAEKALKLMETASTCTEGRAAICEDSECVQAIVGRMMKVSPAATEHAVVVLWSVCHLFRDRRAQEAVAGSNGLSKILLLMQSNCSPAARQMAGDLLKIFRVNSKSCLPSYESKTTHIMPF